jgi:hypothetical protein
VRHVLGALGAEPLRRQLVGRPERTVEEDRVRARQGLTDVCRDGAHAAEVGEQPTRPRLSDAKSHAVLGIGRTRPLEMHRRLAGDDHRLSGEAGRPPIGVDDVFLSTRFHDPPRHLAGETLERSVEDVVVREAASDGLRRVHDERMRLSERQEPEAVVEVTVGQHDGGDR